MIETQVLKSDGSAAGTFSFDEAVLGGKVRKRLLKQAVVMYRANQRTGTAHSKTKAEKAGSNAKLWRQKGTGRARVGMRRAPHRKGGGAAFGPRHRDFGKSMPKKARRVAMQSALLAKFADGQVVVVDEIPLPEVKTKVVASLLKGLGIERTCLLVTADAASGKDLVRAGRNIPTLSILPASDLNAFDLLRHQTVLMTRQVAEALTGSGS